MLTISIAQLEDIIAHAVDYGMTLHMRSLDPDSDRLSKSQAQRYITRLGYSVAQMKRWEDDGLLRGEKSGFSRTSPVYYSASEIKKLVCAVKVKRATIGLS